MGCSPKVMPGSTAALMMYVSVCAFIILCAAFGCTCWGRVNAAEVTQTDAMLALVTLLRWLLGNPGRRRQPHKIILKAGLFFPGWVKRSVWLQSISCSAAHAYCLPGQSMVPSESSAQAKDLQAFILSRRHLASPLEGGQFWSLTKS